MTGRSLYVRIALASLITVAVSLGAFLAIFFAQRSSEIERIVRTSQSQHLAVTLELLTLGHRDAAAAHLARLDASAPASHYVTDAQGIDVITGENRSALLNTPRARFGPTWVGRRFLIVEPSMDGRYRMILLIQPIPQLRGVVPYFALVVVAIGLLSWALASGIVNPLRHLTSIVTRFGQGDLRARVDSSRPDEIGRLACAFDDMANRLETLITAERRLLQDISHELRSPLARLTVAIELAERGGGGRDSFMRVQKEVRRLTSLVDSLVEVTRAEGDPSMRRTQIVALDRVIDEVIADCSVEAEAHQCRLLPTLTTPLLVNGDAVLLQRAVENVLRNAIRYAPTGSAVDIALSSNGANAEVSIRDYGPGVPDEMLPNLTAPFFRVEEARDYSPDGGVGLGLSIAKRAVSVHGGTIAIENAQPGLRVTIRIPPTASVLRPGTAVT